MLAGQRVLENLNALCVRIELFRFVIQALAWGAILTSTAVVLLHAAPTWIASSRNRYTRPLATPTLRCEAGWSLVPLTVRLAVAVTGEMVGDGRGCG